MARVAYDKRVRLISFYCSLLTAHCSLTTDPRLLFA